ncbi:hypothetical protein J6590_099098 [Homalodisca vitripennis]|nr:hypothetical protein J6590_032389 [Homalodisca vitripennis]KAG8328911.1 hypothetical protein J6590_099098 [Homalodisca vitripennis]
MHIISGQVVGYVFFLITGSRKGQTGPKSRDRFQVKEENKEMGAPMTNNGMKYESKRAERNRANPARARSFT